MKLSRPLVVLILTGACFAFGVYALGYVGGVTVARLEDMGGVIGLRYGAALLLALVGLMIYVLIRSYKTIKGLFEAVIPGKGEEARALVDLLFGDLDDPAQRKVLNRTIIASAVHGFILSGLFMEDQVLWGVFGDGVLIKMVMAGLFLTSFVWLYIEGRNFARLDPFWVEISVGPMAVAGLLLVVFILFYGFAVEVFQVPVLSAVSYYFFYIAALLVLCVRKAVYLSGVADGHE